WRFDPTSLGVTLGQTIAATNYGGEKHTFTLVAQFGGGSVPSLNTASGNPVEAPECKTLADSDIIAPGGTFTTPAQNVVGTRYYQCCIHPWMRSTVNVASR